MLGSTPEALTTDILARYGVKIVLRGHGTFTQTVRTIYESLAHQASGAPSADLAGREPTPEMMGIATGDRRLPRRPRRVSRELIPSPYKGRGRG